jgi:hypothetical protein
MEMPRANFDLGCGSPCRAGFLKKRDAARSAFEGTQIWQRPKSLRSSDQLHGLSAAWALRLYGRGIFCTHGEAHSVSGDWCCAGSVDDGANPSAMWLAD